MKRRMLLTLGAVIILIGIAKATDVFQPKTEKIYFVCTVVEKEDTSRNADISKVNTGVCVPLVDGCGYGCVRKSAFRKGNCNGSRMGTKEEVEQQKKVFGD